ncbi:hypothetical protein CLAIMM_14179 [Cladophialophora immunda]|nr:hypothetical protein CLAIMM_14179 [Cladophialophora immunda]
MDLVSFREILVATRPEEAPALCATIADSTHCTHQTGTRSGPKIGQTSVLYSEGLRNTNRLRELIWFRKSSLLETSDSPREEHPPSGKGVLRDVLSTHSTVKAGTRPRGRTACLSAWGQASPDLVGLICLPSQIYRP